MSLEKVRARLVPQVIWFGDSHFQDGTYLKDGCSLLADIQTHVIRRYIVVNQGLCGYNTSHGLKILPEIIHLPGADKPRIEHLYLLWGANDACDSEDEQYVPIEEYKENLRGMITHPHVCAHNPKIAVVTPPPVDEKRYAELSRGKNPPAATRRAKTTWLYAEAARQVAAEFPNVFLMDLWQVIMDHATENTPGFDKGGPMLGDPDGGQSGYLEQLFPKDGLHGGKEMYQIFANMMKPHVDTVWAGTDEED